MASCVRTGKERRMAFVTIRDVAREAGVSIAAVSQILHDKGKFSDETRRIVLQAVDKLGYVPDRRASTMRSSETKTIGLLVPNLRNPYFADLVAAMEDSLYARGYTPLIGSSAESVVRQDEFITNLLGQRIDGAIMVPQGVDSPGIRSLTRRGLPLVFVDRQIPGVGDVPFIVSDPYPGIRSAVESLVGLGHRRVGFVAHPALGAFSVDERGETFERIAGELLPGGGVVMSCDSTYGSRRDALMRLYDLGVSAIVCAYSLDAITMVGLLHDMSVEIGRDMSLVSFDDIEAFRLMTPSIAVISQQADVMGLRGVDMLLSVTPGGRAGDWASCKGVWPHEEGEREGDASSDSAIGGGSHDIHHVPTVYVPRRSVGPAPVAVG